MFIVYVSKLLTEEGLAQHLENPNRPGPDYYKDCKNWNWIEILTKNHRDHLEKQGIYNIYGVDMNQEEIDEMNKLLNNS